MIQVQTLGWGPRGVGWCQAGREQLEHFAFLGRKGAAIGMPLRGVFFTQRFHAGLASAAPTALVNSFTEAGVSYRRGTVLVLTGRDDLAGGSVGSSEECGFRATAKEKADPSGKRRLRDDNLNVLPQTVNPRPSKTEGMGCATHCSLSFLLFVS
jgi:hypothetical protein